MARFWVWCVRVEFGGGVEFLGLYGGLVWVVGFWWRGGCLEGVYMYIYIYILPRSPKKFRFQTIDFLPPPCYNGNVKDKWGKEDLG